MDEFRNVEESQTLLINQQSKLMESKGKEVFRFGFGQSPFLPPESVMNALKENGHRKDYTSVQGDEELRSVLAAFHQKMNDIQCDKNHVLIAPGSKILLYTIMLSFQKADVLMAAPSWVSYAPQAKLAGHHLIRISTNANDRWRITPEDFETALAQKRHRSTILIINYPGNPDGLSYTKSELIELAALCRKHDITVISDEIYGLLSFDIPHTSFATIYPEKTITTTGMSKWCGAGGWRLGAALLYPGIDPKFKQALIGIGSETYSCAPTPVQIAAKEAYGNIDTSIAYIDRECNVLRIIANYCYDQLKVTRTSIYPPQGGFYLFPDFNAYHSELNNKGITTSSQLCTKILEDTGVALLPGTAFGIDEQLLVARLSFVDFDDPLEKTTFELEKDCPRVIEGMNRLIEWLQLK